jgi:hypothetical protein
VLSARTAYYSTANTFSDLFYGWRSLYPGAPSTTTTLVVTAALGGMAPGYGYINSPGIIVAYDFTPRVSVHGTLPGAG